MKRAALVLACGSALMLSACNRGPAATPTATPAATPAATPTAGTDAAVLGNALPPPSMEAPPAQGGAPVANLQRLRGQGVMGKDGYGVTPCGEAVQRIVEFGPGAAKVLEPFVASGAREFFIDAWAGPGSGDHLAVSRIERIYSEGPGCDESLSGTVFMARGNEPFWSLRSGQAGVTLERPGVAAVTGPFTGVVDVDGGGKRVESDTPAGKLVVQFTPATCSDGMSDAIYGWTATASLRNEQWSGCGFAGLPADRH